tara:strand:- start:541 stop:1341 length:801 start_codon:yes stop_codon:yes gene_type:complete
MDSIIQSGCSETIKNSSFKNYKSISIKLFNIINKTDYNENMSEEEIMIGFGKVVNKFEKLKEYLDSNVNNFKITTKKNYINNLLNVILKIKDIDNYCIKKKKKLEDLKKDIKDYWIFLRMLVDDNKKEKNEIEKQKEENDEEENVAPVELTDEELSLKKFDDSIKQGFKYGEELDEEYKLKQEQKEMDHSEEETYNDINMLIIKTEVKANLNMKIFKLDCDLSTLKLEEKILDQEIEFKKKLLKIKQTHIKNLQEQKGDYEDYINL